jgi:hypothetical protein
MTNTNPQWFTVAEVVSLQQSMTERWHEEPITNDYTDFLAIVCQQHEYNYRLWHEEDEARDPHASDTVIAQVKRRIDKLNQARNDWIERLDDAIASLITDEDAADRSHLPQNTETPGSAIDRLSIMALRIYHTAEQLQRSDASAEHLAKCQARLDLCQQQHRDLQQSLAELLDDLRHGRKRHRLYRQMKMYNDPTLNPVLYRRGAVTT